MTSIKGLSGRAKVSKPLAPSHSPSINATKSSTNDNREAPTPISRKRKYARITNSYELHPGAAVLGRIDLHPKFHPPPGTLAVRVAPFVHGLVCITQVHPPIDWTSQPFKPLAHDQFVRCRVIEPIQKSKLGSFVCLSLREDVVEGEVSVQDEKDLAEMMPEEGQLVRGFVVSLSKAGCFVRVARGVTAFVKLKNLADGFIEKPAEMFPVGKLVAGRVVSCDKSTRRVELSLKSTTVIDPKDVKWTWKSVEVGLSLPGTVRRCEKYGVFIAIDNSANLVGLCHKSKLEDDVQVADASTHYTTGDRVKVKVLSVDPKKKRLALGLKPSYFVNDPDSEEEEDSEEEVVQAEPEKESGLGVSSDESDEEVEGEAEKEEQDSVEDEEGESDDSGEEETSQKYTRTTELASMDDSSDSEEERTTPQSAKSDGGGRRIPSTTLQDLMQEANNSEEGNKGDSESESDVDEEQVSLEEAGSAKKKPNSSSKQRERKRKREEAEIAEKEDRLMENDGVLESVEDFERALVSSPNSSLLWIQYISFQLAQTEIEHAKTIAERALNTISFREEEEKRNVWRAYLKLEYKYGSEDTLMDLFKRMLPQWNKKHAYYALAQVYRDDEEFNKADAALKKAVKASKGSSKGAWLQRIELLMDQGKAEQARKLLEAAIRSLPKRKHIQTVLRFVRMEYSKPSGNAERARTACEGLLDAHPKRTDIWHLYIDAEIKFGDAPRARKLFERVTTLRLSAKKMKTFFKKWLVFETESGNVAHAENVKAKARAFVESLGAA